MTEALTPRERLYELVAGYRNGDLDTTAFSDAFERTYNLETDKSTLSDAERGAFGEIFEQVIWYSPFPEERREVPHYVGDDAIARVVDEAVRRLGA